MNQQGCDGQTVLSSHTHTPPTPPSCPLPGPTQCKLDLAWDKCAWDNSTAGRSPAPAADSPCQYKETKHSAHRPEFTPCLAEQEFLKKMEGRKSSSSSYTIPLQCYERLG